MEDTTASASSLVNFALRDIIRAGNLRSRIIDSPLIRGANKMARASVLFVNPARLTFAILYCTKHKALQLFREQSPNPRALRDDWQTYARAFAYFGLDATGSVEIHAAGFTKRSARELLRPYHTPFSSVELQALRALLGATHAEVRNAA